jgi:polysaccharide biosynthesis protein PslG
MLRSLRSRRHGLLRAGALTAAALAVALTVQQGSTAATSAMPSPRGSKAITPAKGTAVKRTFFGMHSSQLADSFPAVPAGSIGSVDLMTDRVYWPDLETSPGTFDFGRLETLVDQAESNGARPLLILGQTPSFHAAADTTYQGVNTVPDLTAWKVFVWHVVEQFGTRLDYQIWPEPNVKPNWLGTPDQMARLVSSAARIIHEIAPGATVVAPGMVLRLRYQRTFMKDFFAQKVGGVPVGDYVDAVGVDPYPLEDGGPEDSLALITQAQHILAGAGVDAPMWTVEVNYGAHVGSIGTAEHSSWSTQTSWVVRTYLLSAGAGIRRVFWLGWSRFQNLDIQMVDTDLVTPTPAAAGYARVAGWLTGQRARGCFHAPDRDLYSCAFVRDGRISWAYWTGSGTAHVAAPAGARKIVKATGQSGLTVAGQRIRVTPVPVWVTH